MAYWTVTNIGTNSFTANIYNLENNFTSDNYLGIWFLKKYLGEKNGTSVLNSFEYVRAVITVSSNGSVGSGKNISGEPAVLGDPLTSGTTYKLYCYAQVSDQNDNTPLYLIKNSSGGNFIEFTTLAEQKVMTAPNEPLLAGKRFQTSGSNYPNAYIKLSGMNGIGARFVWQGEDAVSGEKFELELDDVDGVNVTSKEITFQSLVSTPKFCRTYRMRLGSIDADDNSNYAWSGWSTFTTQPTNILLRYPVFVGRFGNRARIRFNAPSDEYSYYQVEIAESGTGNKTISTINKSDVTQGALFEFNLSRTGIYTITVSVAYVTGTNAVLYAVDENGNRATKSATVNYLRPDYFSWTVTPQTGIATASVPNDDWNRLCQNVNAVVADFLGRGRSPYTENKDEIFLPNDSTLYGNLAGKSIYYVLNFTESQSNVGAKIDADKTLYAWRYNAVNYILCCVNNSDSETDVTNADYAEHFAEGKPVYARYLTALSDKVNGV